MKECQKTLRRARITLLGISRTKNERNSPKGTVQELAEMLEARGVKTSLYDPYVTEADLVEKSQHFAKNLTEAIEGVDVIVITTGHDQFKRLNLKKLKAMMKAPAAIIDLENIFNPEEVEREGFIYRGLGRGVRQK
jgi:UDP-N-acetyl-D-mannosaminuronate dehydrogenase